jgi:hypothetical protein
VRPVCVLIRRELAPGQSEAALVAAWRRAAAAICAKPNGALGGTLYRTEGPPVRYVAVTRWESVEAWRAYWGGGDGGCDPEGDPAQTEVLVEVDDLCLSPNPSLSPSPPPAEAAHP